MNTKFFTNSPKNTLLSKFEGIFQHNPTIREFDVLVGYFYASGYFAIRSQLEGLEKIRILVGIRVDQIIAQAGVQGLLHLGDDKTTKTDFSEQFENEIIDAPYQKEVEDSILQFIADIKNKKIEIKAHPTKNLHAKMYIFRPNDFNSHNSGEVITGSSNLTSSGLGQGEQSNYEFNVSLRDYDDIKFATDEFEQLWQEATPLLHTDLEKTKEQTFLGVEPTPYEIYIKFLIEYFDKEIDYNPNNIRDLPKNFKRLSYQIDAVNQGYEILKKHNGVFLSDVVGLGKTIIGTMIAKEFYFKNDYPEYRSKTLIITPPAIQSNWKYTIEKFNLSDVEYITTGSLHKIRNPEKYDLIIIDESHKFRNDSSESYGQLQTLCKTPTPNNQSKKVMLLSATPLNNRPDDIRNQLLLFQDLNQSTLDIHLGKFFQDADKEYKLIIKSDRFLGSAIKGNQFLSKSETHNLDKNSQEKIKKLYQKIRDKVIEPLTVRRTRSDLITHPMYKEDLDKQGIFFPEIKKPKVMLYELDTELNELYDQTLKKITDSEEGLQYTRYKLISYLKPEHREDYAGYDFLIGLNLESIMKGLLLKRLDSSFTAFYGTIKRFVRYSQAILTMFENNKIIIAPNVTNLLDKVFDDEGDNLLTELEAKKETDPSIKILTNSDFSDEVVGLLETDHKIFVELEKQWSGIIKKGIDPKYDKFVQCLDDTLLNQQDNPNQKLVIFSESTETTDYLYSKLKEQNYKLLSINANNRKNKETVIRENFDANINKAEQKHDYDIIITTEVLAEGINLHRANTIVNYDTPWNATRLMQRIGRINRVGGEADAIRIFNFLPTAKVEKGIGLRRNAQIKLQAFHAAFGEDSQVYTDDEEVETFGLFDQVQQEELSERLQYLMELRNYRQANEQEFAKIKEMPLKIRNAVSNQEYKNQTVCYLRTQQNHAFYLTRSTKEENYAIEELGFLEVAKLFKCSPETSSIKLPNTHHQQVQQATSYFAKNSQNKNIQETQNIQLSARQTRVIQYLEALKGRAPNQQLFSEAVECVKKGSIIALEKDIDKLRKNSKKAKVTLEKQLESAMNIINKKMPKQMETTSPPREALTKHSLQSNNMPRIVISQSYE